MIPNPIRRVLAASLLCSGMMFSDQVFGQVSDAIKLANIAFGSPEATAMAKYGNMDVSLFKGVPSVTVPLHEFSLKDFSLPVFLSYDASGIRVDQIATAVGLGWSLHAGGQITQVVHGLNDLQADYGEGPLEDLILVPEYLEDFNPNLFDGINSTGADDYNYAWNIFNPLTLGSAKNLKPDMFFYNYGGNSGKFIGEGNGGLGYTGFFSVPYRYQTIELVSASEFRISDADGNLFIFDKLETTTTGNDPTTGACPNPGPNGFINTDSFTWHLGMVVTNNSDTLLFHYNELDPFTYSESVVHQKYEVVSIAPGCPQTIPDYVCSRTKTVEPQNLARIEWVRGGMVVEQVDFLYKTAREDFGNSSYKRLDSVYVRRHGLILNRYGLRYDYFGSGGQEYTRLRLDSIQAHSMPPYRFDYDESIGLPARGSPNQDKWGYYNGSSNSSLVPHFTGSTGTGDRSVNAAYMGGWSLKQIDWPTGGHTVLNLEGFEGGLRVKSIHDVNGMGETTGLREFTYVPYLLGDAHSYLDTHEIYLEEDYDPHEEMTASCVYNKYSSASVIPLTSYDGPEIGNGKVTVTYGPDGIGGRTVSRYSTSLGELGSQSTAGNYLAVRWGLGELISQTHYDTSGYPIQRTVNTFKVHHDEELLWDVKDEVNQKFLYGLDIRLRRAELFIHPYTYPARFDVQPFRIVSAQYHADSTYNYSFDPQDSTKYVLIKTKSEYDNLNRVTVLTEVNSDNAVRRTSFTYAGESKKVATATLRDISGNLLQKRRAVRSGSLGSGRAEIHKIYDFLSASDSVLVAKYLAYDAWGNPLASTDTLGTITRYYFGSNASPFSQAGLNGVKGSYLTGIITDSAGIDLRTQARYDAYGRMDTLIDANSNKTRYAYDSMHRLVNVKNHANELVSANEYTYVGSGLTSSNPNWIRTTNHLTASASTISTSYFDGLGRPIQTHLREGSNDNVIATSYDALGRPDKQWSTYIQSNSSHIYRPSFATEAAAYYDGSPGPNAFGRPYVQTAYEASPLGRPIRSYPQKTSSTLDSVQTSYGLASYGGVLYNLTETIDESGKKSRTYTDGWGRTIVSTASFGTPDSASTKFDYDLLGRLMKVTSPEGRLTHYRYDNLGRMTAKTTPDADGDLDGNPSDETGISTSVDFEYAYDNAGNLTAMRDPNRKAASQFVFSRYDTLGRKTAEGICASTWPTGCATGGTTSQVIEYTWDDASVGSAVSFTINNAKGRLTKVAFQGGYYLYSYDADGNIERTYIKLDGIAAGKTVAYSYDRQGNLKTRWFEQAGGSSEKFEHRFSYDALGRLDSLITTAGPTTMIREANYTWWPDGNMKTEKIGTPTNTFAYDARGRLTSINNTASTSTKFSAAYVWNPNSTLQISEYRQTGSIHSDKRYRHSFTYDGRNQMRTADYEYHNGSTWADRYDFDIGQIYYDRDGGIEQLNRQNGSEVVDFVYEPIPGSNRMDYVWNNETYDLDADLSYDYNGNMTNGKGITTTTYDWRNLPLSITTSNPVYPFTPITHTYRYDHNGHRVYSSVDSTYTLRGAYGEPIAEYAGGTPAIKYWNYVRPDGTVIGRRSGGVRFYYHRDHLSSTRTVLNASSGVLETYDYMPFGEFMSGRITTSGTGTRPKYTGHAFDDETNLHTMQWRRQIPRYGVFRTPDPMDDLYPGWNSYAYVMNDPMSYTDPTGMCAELMNASSGVYKGDDAQALYSEHCGGTENNEEPPASENEYTDIAIGFTPYIGPMRDIYQGVDSGDYLQASLGVGFLLLDVFTVGGGTYAKVATKAGIRLIRIGDNVAGNAKDYDSLVEVAKQLYPKKAGRDELHHRIPKYLGGSASGPVVKLNAAYHQLITNAFRAEWGYGLRNPTDAQLEAIMRKVYSQFPLP